MTADFAARGRLCPRRQWPVQKIGGKPRSSRTSPIGMLLAICPNSALLWEDRRVEAEIEIDKEVGTRMADP